MSNSRASSAVNRGTDAAQDGIQAFEALVGTQYLHPLASGDSTRLRWRPMAVHLPLSAGKAECNTLMLPTKYIFTGQWNADAGAVAGYGDGELLSDVCNGR
jgi:hypothetical protein